jgi:hypothetical protein
MKTIALALLAAFLTTACAGEIDENTTEAELVRDLAEGQEGTLDDLPEHLRDQVEAYVLAGVVDTAFAPQEGDCGANAGSGIGLFSFWCGASGGGCEYMNVNIGGSWYQLAYNSSVAFIIGSDGSLECFD